MKVRDNDKEQHDVLSKLDLEAKSAQMITTFPKATTYHPLDTDNHSLHIPTVQKHRAEGLRTFPECAIRYRWLRP